ncbi:hypothetical protein AOL_s00080g199 [Orbilia oligospora ATCC 24927]|uniref:Secreted protein n=1 Tax=Arthrobotrys oligospora (strain ATCC 24927 / CBS 115.81 / DSM 1491) TaxID=756982 RepID=G1XEG4_ARTOA|nr:hypothetical protein AOL_s00080g199 [Orbilia oligospora ATCC 24927]EGX48570.1 hypothetical protein AOL_s00080g199 [Orbilia oligospora ATCC 24927]
MVWFPATAFIALLGVASSAVIVERENSLNSPCTKEWASIITVNGVQSKDCPSPPWKNGAINANNNRFYIGNSSVALCANDQLCNTKPSQAQFILHHEIYMLRLHVGVLGGQQVYIDKKGALRYNGVKEPLPVTWTAAANGWDAPKSTNRYQTLRSREVKKWWACPEHSSKKNTGPWQVFADTKTITVKDSDVPSKKKSDCVTFSLGTEFVTPLFYNNVGW